MGRDDEDDISIDFAVACWREEGVWTVSALPARSTTSADALIGTLRQFPGEGGVFGLVGVSDEFFLAIRQMGERTRALISDGTAVLDWDLAAEVAEVIGLDGDDDELEDFEPVGDLSLFADFGFDSTELALLCADVDLYPDEQVRTIAKRMGFLPQLSAVIPAG